MPESDAFSANYRIARSRFVQAAREAGCAIESIPLSPEDGSADALSIDVAMYGGAQCERAVIVSSGLHGVEGFLGSAVQLESLRHFSALHAGREDLRLIFIHALNPFGFAEVRRANEDNIDLNRNFIIEGEDFSGAPERYGEIERLLGLSSPPRFRDLFFAKLLYAMLNHGKDRVKDAIAGGQYVNEKGLFFGGLRPSRTQLILRENFARWIGSAKRIFHLDFHTGLGRRATYKLIVDHSWDSSRFEWLAGHFGRNLVEPKEPVRGVSYHTKGSLGPWCQQFVPGGVYDMLVAEFGTYPGALVLWALRAENQCHWYRSPSSRQSRLAKRILKEAFAPSGVAWRRKALEQGVKLVRQAIRISGEV